MSLQKAELSEADLVIYRWIKEWLIPQTWEKSPNGSTDGIKPQKIVEILPLLKKTSAAVQLANFEFGIVRTSDPSPAETDEMTFFFCLAASESSKIGTTTLVEDEAYWVTGTVWLYPQTSLLYMRPKKSEAVAEPIAE
ncbi:hypothetical protein OHC33_011220 [Knufia fluminis]|uniref:Uncharacterized protein n=1 Tax=Knufia fluminis TaxID=191047 RepID=A0AAN8EDA5_9EURO|nr:hypothetical protein OHC33_011220 [Knufia fluminis]